MKLKIPFKILQLGKISTFNCCFLGSVITHKSIRPTIAFIDTHSFRLVWPKNMKNISNEEANNTLLFCNNSES